MGVPIARALLRAGARVVVPSRTPERLTRSRAAVADVATDRLIGVVADLGTLAGAEQVRARTLVECGRVDAVAVALGGWPPEAGQGATPCGPARPVLDDALTAHFVTAGALFAPLAAARPHGGGRAGVGAGRGHRARHSRRRKNVQDGGRTATLLAQLAPSCTRSRGGAAGMHVSRPTLED